MSDLILGAVEFSNKQNKISIFVNFMFQWQDTYPQQLRQKLKGKEINFKLGKLRKIFMEGSDI